MGATRLIFLMFSSMLVVLVSCAKDHAAAPSPDYATDCQAQKQELVSCLDAVTGKQSPPSKECCTGIADIVNNKPICLCYIITAGAQVFNVTRALELPMLCAVMADPHQCDGFPGFPSTGSMPPMPPMAPPPTTDSEAPAPVAGGPAPKNAATSTMATPFLVVSAMALLALIY